MKSQLFPRHALPIFFFCFFPNLFPSQTKQKIFFALHCHYNGDTQCRVLFDLGNSSTRWKTTNFKILKNSQFAKFAKFRMKTHFFLDKLYQQLFDFTLSLHWWYSIPSLVWFGQLLDPMKKNFFKILKNSQFLKFAKFCIKNHFFPRQAIPTTFLLCTLITLLILNTKFGLIWTTHWPAEKNLKFSKIRTSRNSQNSVWNPNFFLGTLYQFFFLLFPQPFS